MLVQKNLTCDLLVLHSRRGSSNYKTPVIRHTQQIFHNHSENVGVYSTPVIINQFGNQEKRHNCLYFLQSVDWQVVDLSSGLLKAQHFKQNFNFQVIPSAEYCNEY